MFIRKTTQRAPNGKRYTYYRLVESLRLGEKVKQVNLLHLGQLELAEEKIPLLARRIQEMMHGQQPLFDTDPEVESLAFYYAQQLRNKEQGRGAIPAVSVELDSIEARDSRTVGAEQVGWSWYGYLKLDELFVRLGLTRRQRALAAVSILGRLIAPGSERSTREWIQQLSGLGELLGEDFTRLSKNSLYEIADALYAHKSAIEDHLQEQERSLFQLKEHIILYDLTNTYLEGSGRFNARAQFGHSKEKRKDCRLITMGLVVDEQGFVKHSAFFSGNQSEPETLKEMVISLAQARDKRDEPITVVIDAGIATEANLRALQEAGINYVAVSRRRYEVPEEAEWVMLREGGDNRIRLRVVEEGDEKVLYVESLRKGAKARGIRSRFQELFEAGLLSVKDALQRPHGTKRYEKVLERVGRLKERYRQVSGFYEITVQREGDYAVGLQFRVKSEEKLSRKYSGGYFLRTNRRDLGEKDIWEIYNLIRRIEQSFESLKSELGFRPIYHQRQHRSDAHLFISVLAYHLLNSIETRLRAHGEHRRWKSIRRMLSSHTRVTVSLRDKNKRLYRVRLNVRPTQEQRKIYRYLLVPEVMLPPKLAPG